MSLVENEQIKLTATALNGVAITAIAAGVITPLAAITFGVPGAGARGALLASLGAVSWLILRLCLHLVARRPLRGLRP